MNSREIAEKNEIIRVTVGSRLHGLATGDDDQDEMGVFIEPPEYCLGITKRFDSYVWRTQPDGVRSGPGDVDLVIYSLRKYAHLAAQGNPSILTLLFVPNDGKMLTYGEHPSFGVALRMLAPAFVSRQAGHRFLGYLRAQRDRLIGARGQARLPSRPELVERYGYDTKYAGHMVRLGLQGVELLETGRFTLPMPEPYRTLILDIRNGKSDQETVLHQTEYLEFNLARLLDDSPLQEYPDYDTINRTLIEMHQEYWRT